MGSWTRLQLCLLSRQKNMHKTYYLLNSLIFVHRIQVIFNSENTQELTPVPPNRGKHKHTVTTDIFTFCKTFFAQSWQVKYAVLIYITLTPLSYMDPRVTLALQIPGAPKLHYT